jgi:hypothetical protein
MNDWVRAFVSELHTDGMKPRGYKKTRHTFSRSFADGVIRFQLQGSQWNSDSSEAWTFYVNAGVMFSGLPEPVANRGFPKTHVYGRLGSFVEGCEDTYELTPSNSQSVRESVLSGVDAVCVAIETRVGELRANAEAGRVLWHDPSPGSQS